MHRKGTRSAARGPHSSRMGSSELASWRRFQCTTSITIITSLMLLAFSASLGEARDLSQITFMPTQPVQQQQAQHQQLATHHQERCKIGAPLQWRPYLDASSKAYLAPAVALASLEHFALAPIQLASSASSSSLSSPSSSSSLSSLTGRPLKSLQLAAAAAANLRQLQPQASLVQHAQSVNNEGVLIEATFKVRTVLRRPARSGLPFQIPGPVDQLRPGRLISLHYRVSPSLATSGDILALASSSLEQQVNQSRPFNGGFRRQTGGGECALELSENELTKKGADLFKVGRDYVLFVEPAPISTAASGINLARKLPNTNSRHQQHQQQHVGTFITNLMDHQDQWHAFATHEPVSNQTSRSVNRVLCKNCVRAPTVRLVNSTFVSVATQPQQQQQQQQQVAPQQAARRRIKLDCRVSGNPTPWVEWFRNGKLLRNKTGRTRIKTSPWKGRPNERLSRLELELTSGRNETAVYECRAMNVAAREPAVGTYTLLVLPAQFALFPMQQAPAAKATAAGTSTSHNSNNNNNESEASRGQASATPKTNKTNEETEAARDGQSQTTTRPVVSFGGGGSTTTLAPPPSTPPSPQHDQQGGGTGYSRQAAADGHETPSKDAPNQTGTKQATSSSGSPSATGDSKSSPVVVGQPCPREAHDNFCLNRGTCVLIGHIEEYFCNCAEGYHGHRCEYKSLGHQQSSH